MAEHILKVVAPYFDALLDGSKTFEVRKNDRGFQRGDVLTLWEFDPAPGKCSKFPCGSCQPKVRPARHHLRLQRRPEVRARWWRRVRFRRARPCVARNRRGCVMGWTWEVCAYRKELHGYEYVTVWTGESFFRMLLEARKAKKTCGCVKVEWR